MDLEALVKQAERLDAKQRAELLARLSLQATTVDAGHVRDQVMWAEAVYDALVALNGGSGRGLPGPALIKRAMGQGSAWSSVAGFMESSKYDALKVVERQAIYQMLAKLLLEHAQDVSEHTGAPLTPKLLATCCSNITAIFNRAFPGYLRAGLGLIVARQLTARRPHQDDQDVD